jgi:hypothetical protein
MSVIKLVPPTKASDDKEINPELVTMFEQMLEWAKNGTIVSGAVVMTYPDGASGNGFNTRDPILLIGELRCLEREILDICIDGRLHEAGDPY